MEGSLELDEGRGGSVGGEELSSSWGKGSGNLIRSGMLCKQGDWVRQVVQPCFLGSVVLSVIMQRGPDMV